MKNLSGSKARFKERKEGWKSAKGTLNNLPAVRKEGREETILLVNE